MFVNMTNLYTLVLFSFVRTHQFGYTDSQGYWCSAIRLREEVVIPECDHYDKMMKLIPCFQNSIVTRIFHKGTGVPYEKSNA